MGDWKEQMRAPDQVFREIFDQAAVGIAQISLDGTWLRVNSRYCQMLGYSEAELLSKTLHDINPPNECAEILSGRRQLLEGVISSHSMEKRYVRKDGTIFWGRLHRSLVRDHDNLPQYFIAVVEDITEKIEAARALRDSEQRLRLAMSTGVGLWEHDLRGATPALSPIYAQTFGRSPRDHTEWFELVHPDDRPHVMALVRESIEKVSEWSTEFRVVGPDGGIRWLLAKGSVLLGDDGRPSRIAGVSLDITARKRAEDALQESEQRFRNMANTAPVMIWVTGPDKLFTFVNKTWLDFTGRTIEQELGNGWAAGVHPDDLQRSYEVFSSAFDARRTFQLECRLRRSDGEYRWILCSGIPRSAPGGVFAGYIGSDIDITDLQSEERFRQLAENIDQVFWMFDLGTQRLLYTSPAFEKVWGYNSAAIGQNQGILMESVHPDDRDRLSSLFPKMRSEPVEASYRIVRPDGSVRWIQARSFPICDPTGAPYRVAGIAEDVTAHRELEEQLRQTNKMEAVGRLAGGIAHDFNNLLTVINGYTDILLRKLDAKTQIRAELNEIRGAGQRAQELTSQLLAFNRTQIRTTEVLSLRNVIEDMAKMLRPMIGEDIELVTVYDAELGQVKADRTELTQIVLNLAANARDAMPTGGTLTFETRNIEVDDSYSRNHPRSQPGPHVVLTVIDTGIGMNAKIQQHLFEPFFTTKQVGKGTGLGLATVYGIVSRYGGWIDVKSKLGSGTTFEIYLPRVEVCAIEKTEHPGPLTQPLRGTETVLVVEDQPHVRKLTCAILKEFGYQTLEAAHGEEALRLTTTHNGPLDLVLTDVIMPGMRGPELANRLKGIRHTPVLFMSGYSESMEGQHDPEVAYIRKPFTPDALARKVREVLDTGGRR
jgi:two-component system, cell cycle sensor histidine kinase and response regulator CckA